jgi:hypothetical protein
VHSEFNASSKEEVHLLQIWLMPDTKGLQPMYQQSLLPVDQQNSLLAFPVTIHQDAKVFRGRVAKGHELGYTLNKERGAWVQMISGSLSINVNALEAGDAVVIEKETNLKFTSSSKCEFLLFDLK